MYGMMMRSDFSFVFSSFDLKRGGECLVRDVVFGGGRQVRLCLGEEEGHLGVPLHRHLGDVPLYWRGELLVLPGGLEGGGPHAESGKVRVERGGRNSPKSCTPLAQSKIGG